MKNLTKIILLSSILVAGATLLAIKSKEDKPIRYDYLITVTPSIIKDKKDHSIYLYDPRATFIFEENNSLYKTLHELSLTTNPISMRFNEPYIIDKHENTIYFPPEFVSAEKK